MTISFMDAALGKEKEIEFERLQSCGTCKGAGAKAGTKKETCPSCRGTGQTTHSQGFLPYAPPAPAAGGRGLSSPLPARIAGATGRKSLKKIPIKIPAGVDTGSRLKVSGEGGEGEKGGRPGDLYVILHVEPDSFFERHEDDIVCQIPISFPQAALGEDIEVPSLNGTKKISIPPGTQSGQVFTLRGMGIRI